MKKSVFKIVRKELFSMIASSPLQFARTFILSCFDALIAFGYTVAMKLLIDSLQVVTTSGVALVYKTFAFFAAMILLRDIINGVLNYFYDVQFMKVQAKTKSKLIAKISHLDVLYFEEPQFLDSINKAKQGVENTVQMLTSIELIIVNGLTYFVLVGVYFSLLHPLLLIVLLMSFIPSCFSYFFKVKINSETENAIASERRKMDNYDNAISHRKTFKETRHLNVVNFFKNNFVTALLNFKKYKTKEARHSALIDFVVSFVSFLSFIATIMVLYFLVVAGKINASAIAAVIASVSKLHDSLTEIFNVHIANAVSSYTGLKNYHEVMSLDTKTSLNNSVIVHKLDNTAEERIVFDTVSFRYPNAEKNALNNISFNTNGARLICVVGENGSGKSTLSKLILGLYGARSGRIDAFFSHVSENNPVPSYRESVSSVFQDYCKYATTLCENILISKPQTALSLSSSSEQSTNLTHLNDIIETLPKKEHTLLSKEFDGVDLSGGQWQRLAIERGISRSGNLIVFDEPTSAIDPVFEMQMLENIMSEENHNLKFVITHRIGIATKADMILVMKDGNLVESGTHNELYKLGGEYTRLFDSQSQWYR